jgi:hypothetical protein
VAASINLTPAQRKLRAQLAAHTRWSQCDDPAAHTAAARAAADARFEKIADPDGKLTPAERERRAASLRKAHCARMALLSSQARAARKAATEAEARVA